MKRRHPDVPALVFGLFFVGVAVWYFVDQSIGVGIPATGWLIAVALILLGVIGILGALRSNANR